MTVNTDPIRLDDRAKPNGSNHRAHIGLAQVSGFAIDQTNDALTPATPNRVFSEAH